MKIRSDFVTNSSSESTAEIVIENLVLLEILQRYKELGVFGDANPIFTIGHYIPDIWRMSDLMFELEIITPAFHLFEDYYGEGWSTIMGNPGSLDEVLTEIINIMDSDVNDSNKYDRDLYEQLKGELQQKKDEINAGYLKVYWDHEDNTDVGEGDEHRWVFKYDSENGEFHEVYCIEFIDEEDEFIENDNYDEDNIEVNSTQELTGIATQAELEVMNEDSEKKNQLNRDLDFETSDDKKILDKYNGTEPKVIIPDGVEAIGDFAFSDCSTITSLLIHNGVIKIGEGAFANCSSLTSIRIPENVKEIGPGAFYGCSNLTSVIILSSLSKINLSVFAGCGRLTSIVIPESVIEIGAGAFYECSNLTSIVIPKGISEIGDVAFLACSSLTSIEIPDNVIEIKKATFAHCSNLTSIVIPKSVKEIGEGAFYECSNLTSIVIPKDVIEIKEDTFCRCFNLMSIVIPQGVISIGKNAFEYCTSLKSVQIPEGVQAIGDNAFRNCTLLTSIRMPDSVQVIGNSAFSGCVNLTNLFIPQNIKRIGKDVFLGCGQAEIGIVYHHQPSAIPDINGLNFICINLLNHDKEVICKLYNLGIRENEPYTEFIAKLLSGRVEHLSAYDSLFSGCESSVINKAKSALFRLEYSCELDQQYKNEYISYLQRYGNYIVPILIKDNKIEFIYLLAEIDAIQNNHIMAYIDQASQLERTEILAFLIDYKNKQWGNEPPLRISLIDKSKSIDWLTYENCDGKLTINKYLSSDLNVTIPAKIKDIPVKKIDGFSIVDSFKISTFYMHKDNIESVIIEDGITAIGDRVFLECRNLKSIKIPGSVTEIGVQAFAGCWNLVSIVLPVGISKIESEVFKGCSRLKSVVIPESVKEIGELTFAGCGSLITVEIPESVKKIGELAFLGCSSLKTDVIPESLRNEEPSYYGF